MTSLNKSANLDDNKFILPETTETEVNEDGIKTRISYKINEKNELIKVTQQIKVITEIKKTSKNVLERGKRLKNKKFGNAKNNDNNNITFRDNCDFKILKPSECEDEDETAGNLTDSIKKFQKKRIIKQKTDVNKKKTDDKYESSRKKYQDNSNKYNYNSLRVSNLSEQTTEQDVHELFNYFGRIQRVFIVRDKITQKSRGFAFITFSNSKDAANALNNLNGYGYDNLILKVEYSIDRN